MVAVSLAAKRLVADEAKRRRLAGLSCEDLPLDHGYDEEFFTSGPVDLEALQSAEDVLALLAVARGGAPAYQALLQERAAREAQERQQRLEEATVACEAGAAPSEVAIAQFWRAARSRASTASDLFMRAAGYVDPRPPSDDGLTWEERRQLRESEARSRRSAEERLNAGDPSVIRSVSSLLVEEHGERASDALVAAMSRAYATIPAGDAAMIIACAGAASEGREQPVEQGRTD